MKKLMIAFAAVAAAGFASAADCGECAPCSPTAACPFGYRLKVMVRTTETCTVGETSSCTPCTQDYRKPAIRRFMGLVYGTTAETSTPSCSPCGEDTKSCACNDWKGNANIALFDYDYQAKMDLDAGTTELLQLNRIGCQADQRNKAEMAFQVGFSCADAALTFAGFGLCGNHDGKITLGSVQGYCAGILPVYIPAKDKCSEGACGSNLFWNLCCNTATECNRTAAYGKWTLVWDSDIASKVGVKLTDTAATTAWGTATPVKLADGRACADAACSSCGE